MKNIYLMALFFLLGNNALCVHSQETPDEVIEIINKVNGYWQTNHSNKVRAFWDDAVYHTGNMEAYLLTGNPEYLEYSRGWAEYNQWKGAKSDDKASWKFVYGESDDFVLFGDWQICFQTYADLYMLKPEFFKIARAREVMEYQMGTSKEDYWFWVDALYMVMPVMTKMYKVTGNSFYLEKLYQYFAYADSIMYDKEAGLYYRDQKYLYPAHRTSGGKKDFWARGDGWALAALTKVLKEIPVDHRYSNIYKERFCKLAESVSECQQQEGYWTRSMLDPAFAPGPETSGTALFAYGLMYGVNSGLLEKDKYHPVIEKAWKYLSNVALQANGKVGYIQPIGEKAIPGQVVNANSTFNFGVGAFLLAACERVKYLEKQQGDRKLWTDVLYKMAAPVLSNISEGTLQKNMQLELSPTWDGRDKRVSYMECFGRLMAGLAPWLSLPDDDTPEGKQRKQLREWALKGYANAVDPASPDYLLWNENFQTLVDAAYVAESFLRGYEVLWMPLDSVTKQRYIREFTGLRRINPLYTNWLLFTATIETFLKKAGGQPDYYRIDSTLRKIEEWYVGDGWYSDGPSFAFDYYNSFAIQPMFFECLEVLTDGGRKRKGWANCDYERTVRRMQRYGTILEHLISPEGTFPVFGRSVTYRTGALQPLALLAWKELLPEELSTGQVRSALTAVIGKMFGDGRNFNENGYLTLGFNGKQPYTANVYTNNGSLYMATLVFLPLGLPADHPFWTVPAESWTSKKAWEGEEFPKDHTYYEKNAMHYE